MPRSANEPGRAVKRIPATENGPEVHCVTRSGMEYIISQCRERKRSTLWKKGKDGFEKLAAAGSPLELYDKVPWDE